MLTSSFPSREVGICGCVNGEEIWQFGTRPPNLNIYKTFTWKFEKVDFQNAKTSSTPNVCSDDKGLPQRQLFPSFISSSPEPNEFYEHSMQMKAEVKIPFPHFVCVWYTYCPNPLQINQSNDHPIRKYLLSVTTTSQYTMGRVLPDSKIPIHWKMLCATFWSGGMTPLSVVVF